MTNTLESQQTHYSGRKTLQSSLGQRGGNSGARRELAGPGWTGGFARPETPAPPHLCVDAARCVLRSRGPTRKRHVWGRGRPISPSCRLHCPARSRPHGRVAISGFGARPQPRGPHIRGSASPHADSPPRGSAHPQPRLAPCSEASHIRGPTSLRAASCSAAPQPPRPSLRRLPGLTGGPLGPPRAHLSARPSARSLCSATLVQQPAGALLSRCCASGTPGSGGGGDGGRGRVRGSSTGRGGGGAHAHARIRTGARVPGRTWASPVHSERQGRLRVRPER